MDVYLISHSFPLNIFSWNEIKITPVNCSWKRTSNETRRQQIEFVGPFLYLSPRLVPVPFSLPWVSLTLPLFSEQRLGFSILPLRVGLWLWCIQRLTTIKVQISVGLGLGDLGEFGWGFSWSGGSGSSAGLEDWVMLVLSRQRSNIFEVATLKSFMGILF